MIPPVARRPSMGCLPGGRVGGLSAPGWSGGNPGEREEVNRLVRSYELVFIAHPSLDGDELTALIETIKELVTRSGGQVTQVKPWGLRRLAYPISGQWEGQYVLVHLDLEPQGVAELERSLKLSEQVLRHLITLVAEEATGVESAEPDAE